MKGKVFHFREFGFPVELSVTPWQPLPLVAEAEEEEYDRLLLSPTQYALFPWL